MKSDMLGSFMKHGITADEAETEVSISLYVYTPSLDRRRAED